MQRKINVGILYQTCPFRPIPGGIDTCIRGIIKFAPEDVLVSVIGVGTKDSGLAPGRWHPLSLEGAPYRFFPLFNVDSLSRQHRVPLSLKYVLSLFSARVCGDIDLLQFHRIEPMLNFPFSRKPKIVMLHHHMDFVEALNSDVRWKHFPSIFTALEKLLLPQASSIFTVHEGAFARYKRILPSVLGRLNFMPTWLDPEVFHPPGESDRMNRDAFCQAHGFKVTDKLLVFVGRIDVTKDPDLLIDAVHLARKQDASIRLLMIGDGRLKGAMVEKVASLGLSDSVVFVGLLPAHEVARHMRFSDALALSSQFEGMPRCVVEALGCGIPVITTNVGNVETLVTPGVNGRICMTNTPLGLADTISQALAELPLYTRENCTEAVRDFMAQTVLGRLYNEYRALAGSAQDR